MGYKWRSTEGKNEDISKLSDKERIKLSIEQDKSFREAYISDKTTFAEMKIQNPTNFIIKTEKWCKYNIAQTYVTNGKTPNNLLSKKNSLRYEELKEYIKSKFNEPFKIKDIISFLNLDGWTSGDKVRAYLHLMVCEGFISKNKTINKKQAYIYEIKKEKPCPYLKEFIDNKGKKVLCCSFNWDNSEETTLYWGEDETK